MRSCGNQSGGVRSGSETAGDDRMGVARKLSGQSFERTMIGAGKRTILLWTARRRPHAVLKLVEYRFSSSSIRWRYTAIVALLFAGWDLAGPQAHGQKNGSSSGRRAGAISEPFVVDQSRLTHWELPPASTRYDPDCPGAEHLAKSPRLFAARTP
jgi:hypothetical protein